MRGLNNSIFILLLTLFTLHTLFFFSFFSKNRGKSDRGVGTDGRNGYQNMHLYAPVFHYVSDKFDTPKLSRVFDNDTESNLNERFAREFSNVAKKFGFSTILSIGSGNCEIEIDIERIMKTVHAVNTRFFCYDPTEEGHSAARKSIRSKDNFVSTRTLPPDVVFSGVFAHHSLHHVSDLNGLVTYVKKNLKPGGVFVVSDMIGRNGHRRWPEQMELIFKLWNTLPKKSLFDYISNCSVDNYPDYDYSICNGKVSMTYEGIHSQDVLPVLTNNFHFGKFFAFGGLRFEFVGRRFGNNFDLKNPAHINFIDKLIQTEESMKSAGHIKPDQFIGTLYHKGFAPPMIYWGNWSPQFCLRNTQNTALDIVRVSDPCLYNCLG